MKRGVVVSVALIACAVTVIVPAASAAFVPFVTRASFAAATALFPTQFVETYDAAGVGTQIPNNTLFNGINYSRTTNFPTSVMEITNTIGFDSPPNTLGVRFTTFVTGFDPSDTLTVTFPQPVRAFGISFSTSSLTPGANRIRTSNNETVLSGLDPFTGQFGQFAGIVSDTPFTSVTIEGVQFFGFALDNLRTAVPEPAIASLIAPLLLLARRR